MSFHKKERPNPYKEANEAFLQVKEQEVGIVALDNGVLYKVLEEGHGTRKPTPRSIVYVNYTGRLIDGTVFDTRCHQGKRSKGRRLCQLLQQ